MSISKIDLGKDESPKPRPRKQGAGAGAVDLADEEGGKDCAICLTRMENNVGGRGAAQLPCLHIFHEECVGKWLLGHRTCPTCRSATWVEAERIHVEPGDFIRPDPDEDDDHDHDPMLLDLFPHWLLYPI